MLRPLPRENTMYYIELDLKPLAVQTYGTWVSISTCQGQHIGAALVRIPEKKNQQDIWGEKDLLHGINSHKHTHTQTHTHTLSL